MADNTTYQFVQLVSTVSLTLFTFVLVYYTRNMFVEAKKTREYQTDPHVIVTAVHDMERTTIIKLVIQNIGNGLAQDIKFSADKKLYKAFGMTEEGAKLTTINDGPLITGIPSLGPGEKREVDWGQCGGLLKYIGNDAIIFTINYKSTYRDMPPAICKVDIASFIGTVANKTVSVKIADTLKTMSKDINQLCNRL